jgi:nucleolin
MNVQYAHSRDGPLVRPERKSIGPKSPTNSLYIGNLSFDMSDMDLHDLFKDMKNVVDVRVAVDRRTGRPRGFAHADFMDISSAQQGKLELADKIIHGRPLYVDYAMQKIRDHLTRVANDVES